MAVSAANLTNLRRRAVDACARTRTLDALSVTPVPWVDSPNVLQKSAKLLAKSWDVPEDIAAVQEFADVYGHSGLATAGTESFFQLPPLALNGIRMNNHCTHSGVALN